MEDPGPPNRIREWRKAANLTLDQLAELVGSTNQHLSRLERGERQLNTKWMNRLAPALRCKPSDLLYDSDSVLSAEERTLLKRYRDLSDGDRDTVARMVTALASAQGNGEPTAN